MKFYPYKKGGIAKVLSMLKGAKKLRDSFDTGALSFGLTWWGGGT